jgi:hypothetical protein
MKKVFFLLLLANFLVFLGGAYLFPSQPGESQRRSGGDLRTLSQDELAAYRARGNAGDDVEEVAPSPRTRPDENPVGNADAETSNSANPTQPGTSYCLALGPLETREEADGLAAQLAQQNMAGIVTDEVETEVRSYVVLVVSEAGDGVDGLMSALRSAGHREVWHLTSGPRSGEVSVGLFRRKENAETRRLQMVADGFAARVVPREIERSSHWVELRPEPSRRMTGELLAALRQSYPGLTTDRRRCPQTPL